ncbi:hypothetical protein BU14_2184s0002 [Porphyra umbilicalis]|uniref:Peptidyl-prolyl cis-trans isomerase n=1 Tax=Porphyra umbilicalis TaxID=2786 RepID=A0A1X6NJP6_PORUM|nr:hypothetical protein BU14_2184s0002 [Porphyra umbilicalis]|eukprot:OSX68841.1 hypothetical protein BU14_2184s0002 [Porphyra umbilicalis]
MGKKGAAAGGGGKGKGKGGGSGGGGADDGKLATCNFVKARHILCEKQGKINDAYKELRDGWLDDGSKVPGPKFGEIAMKYSECSSSKAGGNLGWFPRGKMEGKFQEKAFGNAPGTCSEPFKGSNGWHIVLVEGRRM